MARERNDPNAGTRRRSRDYLKDLPEAEAALRTLQGFLRRYAGTVD